MLDIKFIRNHPDLVKGCCCKKGVKVDIDRLLELDTKRREFLKEIENLRHQLNIISSKKPDQGEIEKGRKIKEGQKEIEEILKKIEREFNDLMLQIPNLPFDDVPVGKNENENVVLRKWGEKPKFDFQPKDYLTLAENLDLIDIKRAAKVSGTRFGYLKNEIVLLELALINLVFETLKNEGFIPIIPPVMISEKAMKGMGYLAHGGEEETYHFEKDKLYFVGTSEQAIGPMYMDEILKENELPKRFLGFSTCFRREAGSYGKDTKGIFRVHQFDKVEMFSFSRSEDSKKEHQFFLETEEKLMRALKIPYRVVQMCTGDLGDPAAAKYDIEAWFPSQNRYRETHSTSNCTDFQSRRLNIRFRDRDGALKFVHTLNGTAFSQRPILAILENYQQKDGSVKIPKVLEKYLPFKIIKR